MILTQGLSKHYGKVRALNEVTLKIQKGEIFGLLGPNGSGKTTLLRLLLGLIRPTRGQALFDGLDCWKKSILVREHVSYIPGEVRLPGGTRGIDLLRYLSALRGGVGIDRALAIAETVMKLDLNRKVRTYSTGMKQKLALAQAFSDPVDLLILDEPTSALDPTARNEVLRLVQDAKDSGQTVIFSGHVLSEVEQVADRVAIMRKGDLMHVEDMHQRRSDLRLLLVRFRESPPDVYPEDLGLAVRERNGEVLFLEHRGDVGPLLGWLATQDVTDIAIGTDDLKALYDRYHGPHADFEAEVK